MSLQRSPLTVFVGAGQPAPHLALRERPLRLGATCAGPAGGYYRTKLYCRGNTERGSVCRTGAPTSLGERCTGRIVFH